MQLHQDKEFVELLPELTSEELGALEENIIVNGCLSPLVVWDGIIVDGNHRYGICQKHGIEFQTVTKHFDSREDAIIFICKNQAGRRNLTQEQRGYVLGKQYEAEKVVSRGGGDRRSDAVKNQSAQNGHIENPMRTKEKVALEMGVGHNTVARAGKFAQGVDAIASVDPEAKQAILSGKSGMTMTAVAEMAKLPESERKEVAEKIKKGDGKKVVQALKQRNVVETRICKKCGKERSATDFDAKRNVCKDCRRAYIGSAMYFGGAKKARSMKDEVAMAEKIAMELYDTSCDCSYTPEYAVQEMEAIVQTFARQLMQVVTEHADLIRQEKTRAKAALSEAEAAIKKARDFLHEQQ